MNIKLEIFYDFDTAHELYINDRHVRSIYSLRECPEDATIGRDLVDGNEIVKLMSMAWEAGKADETFNFVIENKA